MPLPKILRSDPGECFLFVRTDGENTVPVITFHRVNFELAHKFRVLLHEVCDFPLYGIKKLGACQCRGRVQVRDT